MRPSLDQVYHFDILFFGAVFKLKDKRPLRFLMRWTSRSGDGYLYPLIAAAVYGIDVNLGNRFLLTGLVAYAFDLPMYWCIKNAVKRCRPCQAIASIKSDIIPSDPFSFPSGHTAAAFVMASMLAFFFPITAFVAFPWAVAIGFSRIFLGVHYPTDILAGMLLGACAALFGIFVIG